MVYILLGAGFEEAEALVTADVLRRADIPVALAGIGGELIAGSHGIAVRAGGHCAPRMHRALGTEDQGAVRFSFSWFNTEEEIDAAVRAVQTLAEE